MRKPFILASLIVGFACLASATFASNGVSKFSFSKDMKRFASCSKEKLTLVPLEGSFEKFIIIARDLNLDCLQKLNKKLALENEKRLGTTYKSHISISEEISTFDNMRYQVGKLLSPIQFRCGENCRFSPEEFIRLKNKYYFLSYDNDRGLSASVIRKDLVAFKVNMSTYSVTIGLDPKDEQIIIFPNGNLKFEKDSILIEGQKSFIKGGGGAIWFNSRIAYDGSLIEYIDIKDGKCFSISNFSPEMEQKLKKTKLKELCVEQ